MNANNPTPDQKPRALRERDISTLRRADELKRRHDAGIGPRNGGQQAHFDRLERLGLVTFTGWGHDIDGEHPGDLKTYELTEAGRAAVTASYRQPDPSPLSSTLAAVIADAHKCSLKRLAWAYGCSPKGSNEERQLEYLLRQRVTGEWRTIADRLADVVLGAAEAPDLALGEYHKLCERADSARPRSAPARLDLTPEPCECHGRPYCEDDK
jgi:hypothetical protein